MKRGFNLDVPAVLLDNLKTTMLVDLYRKIRGYFIEKYYRSLSDEQYLNLLFEKSFGKNISTENPSSFNEKIQWLKLYWYDQKAELCADKYEVRGYVKEKGLDFLLNELIGVYDDVDEIKINDLPDQFVLKCTHGSGCNIICENKRELNWVESQKKINKWMKRNYYWPSREWVYKNIKPRIVCEKYLSDKVMGELVDYKFYCFNGRPEYIKFASERHSATGVKMDFFDKAWNHLDVKRGHPMGTIEKLKPKNFELMLDSAIKLSQEFPFVRVDFYEANGKLYFGELTFFPAGGFEKFEPEKYDYFFGDKLTLPKRKG